jgi:signal transduction histidine kinase
VQQLARVLLSNAWKFTRHRPHARIRVTASTLDGVLAIAIADNGVGFDPAAADKLFKPFHRLHHRSEFEGLGIGLALVRKIVACHGGAVTGESAATGGAVFRFHLGAV